MGEIHIMVDNNKRTTLKAISGVTAAAIFPASVNAAASLFGSDDALSSASADSKHLSISMVSGHGRWHTVQLTNTSDKAVTLKHVYPGLVSVDNKKYDVNSLFRTDPLVVEPGETHVGLVAQQYSTAQEVELPRNVTRQHTFTLATQYNHFGQIKPVVTTRHFLPSIKNT